jgi:hypothetical protein
VIAIIAVTTASLLSAVQKEFKAVVCAHILITAAISRRDTVLELNNDCLTRITCIDSPAITFTGPTPSSRCHVYLQILSFVEANIIPKSSAGIARNIPESRASVSCLRSFTMKRNPLSFHISCGASPEIGGHFTQ